MVSTDCWAEWIRTRRSGGDPEYEAKTLENLAVVRERVLDAAALERGETLLDVGCGNGLIGFGALDRGARQVVFADVSAALLEDCRELAAKAGVVGRCRFVEAQAEDLRGVADESLDVVTTRSVLIYVADKERAFREFHRVLLPGGRASIFEPINRFGLEERRGTWGYAVDGEAAGLIGKVIDSFRSFQPEDDPMFDFDERDLFSLAERAGFFPVTLEYRAEAIPLEPRSWESFLHSAPNPKIPTFAEAMDAALTADEHEVLVTELRPAVEEGRGVWRMGSAFLRAVKPE
ncbi:MAG TPA: class I SAM-dependent methyltransferase [Gaiellaceae bacterium]|nr:class I SAM-dependent methyltransferase [Gaiellaceae bacterium]